MAKQRNALRAGIFMVVSLGLTIFVILTIAGTERFLQKYHHYLVVFPLQSNVCGLRAGDDVRIGGFTVGSVRDVRIGTEDKSTGKPRRGVVVIIDVPTNFVLAKDAHVQLDKDITGNRAINILDLGNAEELQVGDYLLGQPDALTVFTSRLRDLDLRPLLDEATNTIKDVHSTVNDVHATVNHVHSQIPEMIAHYHRVADAAIKLLDDLHQWFGSGDSDFHLTLKNAATASGTFKEKLPPIMDQVGGILKKFDDAMGKANDALVDIKAITGSTRSIIVDNRGKLDVMIANLKTTSDNLKYASIEIRHSPWRLLYQPKEGEMANLNIYDSVRQFAQGAAALQDAAQALRDASGDNHLTPQDMQKLMQQLDDSFAHFQKVQAKLWQDVQP